jgi:predicted Zn-dependent peptidase
VKDVLPNGLQVVTIEMPHLHSVSVVAYAKVGSRYEDARDNGLSHFLEHMLFRGTDKHPSSYELSYAIEQLGGTLYAETGRDYSLYQVSLHPETLLPGLLLFGEILHHPLFADIELERAILLEEINEDLDEDGNVINIDDLAREAAWPDHPLGFPITGPLANVERFTEADVRRHFDRFYGARNLVLCIAGPVRHGEIMAGVRDGFATLRSGQEASIVSPVDTQTEPRFVYVDNPGSQTAVQLLFRGVGELDPDYPVQQALLRVLDDGMSTRLHYRICDQKGLAYYVSAGVDAFIDTALFEIDGTTAHAKVGALVDESFALIRELREGKVSPDELAKLKRRYRWDLEGTFDDPDGLAAWFGGGELFRPPVDFDTKLARTEAITVDDMARVAERLFRPERLTLAAVGGLEADQEDELRRKVERFG